MIITLVLIHPLYHFIQYGRRVPQTAFDCSALYAEHNLDWIVLYTLEADWPRTVT